MYLDVFRRCLLAILNMQSHEFSSWLAQQLQHFSLVASLSLSGMAQAQGIRHKYTKQDDHKTNNHAAPEHPPVLTCLHDRAGVQQLDSELIVYIRMHKI
jgi:hypothetical protein